MMSFCKKSVHYILGFTNSMVTAYYSFEFDKQPPCKHGLGLITATADSYRPPNIIESTVAKPLPPLPPHPTHVVALPTAFSRKDPGGIGFIDDIGGGVDGLMSCTESLGFESSDERIVDDHMEMDARKELSTRAKWRKDGAARREIKKFPPPLSSFNRNGRPSLFLRSVRTDGRLELTEVSIDRPEILRASREDGRLRLHLIREDEFDSIKQEDEDEQQQQQNQQQEEELQQEQQQSEEEEEKKEKEEEEERVGDQWKFQVSGEGFRRCTELMNHDYHRHHHHQNISHHHNLHMWSQQCVPTR